MERTVATERKSPRDPQQAVAVVLLIVGGLLAFTFTRGVNFLSSASIIFIGVQAVVAINFHLLAPRSSTGVPVRSHEPFRFRTSEEMLLSAAFAIAGIATLVGVLHAGSRAGWLALGAAAMGIANVVATYRYTVTGAKKSPELHSWEEEAGQRKS